jgi:hypothetical protein
MARVTPEQAAAKWQSRLSGATQQITDGVNRVQRAPGAAAAANKAAWLARVTASADKWARNVSAVSLEDWKAKMTSVGIPRIAQGATANVGKVQNFQAAFLPYLDQGVARVKAMPNATLEDGIARATAMIRHNANFRRSGGTA